MNPSNKPPRSAPNPEATNSVDSSPLSRRKFLALAGGLGLAAAAGSPVLQGLLNPERAAASSKGSNLGSTKARTLVLVTLYGGNDGLNTVVPYQDPNYAAARGPMALDPSTVLALSDGFGLHPSMPGFKKLWDAKELAIVHGVGFANPNYSHFESMDIWQAGSTDPSTSTGWIGRWLDKTKSSPLRAVGIGPTLAPALAGAKVQGAAVPPGPMLLPGSVGERSLFASLAKTDQGEALLLAESARSESDLLLVDKTIGPILDRSVKADPLHLSGSSASGSSADQGALAIANGGGGLSSANVLAVQLSAVANLILAGAPTQVYSVELGGFDTHSDQTPTQQTLLSQLDSGVSAFLSAVASNTRGRQTVVMIFTEFGRRVLGNASAGTDHGWANVVFVAGKPVKGGFYGEPPSLTNLSEGNLVYTTDFRSVYASMFDQVIGVDPKPFLSGNATPLPVV
jgi:uncharacterized protein (DUF1501 family)